MNGEAVGNGGELVVEVEATVLKIATKGCYLRCWMLRGGRM